MTPWVILAAIAGYFALLFIISAAASRGGDNASFFNGGRKTPWALAAFAAMGAAMSGVTFTSVPGMVVGKGYSYMQMALGFIVGYIVIAYLLVPLFYKKNMLSIYGYLGDRYGESSYRTGAWFFFISKMLGASVRFYVICVVLQSLVFGPLGVPFVLNVTVTVALIFLYTLQGGVKTIIWTDVLKSFCLIASVVLCIIFIGRGLGMNAASLARAVADDSTSRVFFFDNPKEATYFWKQFLSGIFMVIATTGLDQDLMQRNLSCRDYRSSQKSMVVTTLSQTLIIALFLVLGSLLVMYYRSNISAEMPARTDELFGLVAFAPGMPVVVGILFILGLVSSAYSAAGSALTALTTSFTVDILHADSRKSDAELTRTRKVVHVSMAVCMGLVMVVFYMISSSDAISAVYTIASYTYGPILGLFAFGMACRKEVRDKWVPAVCLASPVICFFVKRMLLSCFGYEMSFELLLLNASLTALGLALLVKRKSAEKVSDGACDCR